MLLEGEPVVGSDKGADEGRHEHGRPRGIHQTEADGVEKSARLLEGPDRFSLETPLRGACLEEFGFGHGFD